MTAGVIQKRSAYEIFSLRVRHFHLNLHMQEFKLAVAISIAVYFLYTTGQSGTLSRDLEPDNAKTLKMSGLICRANVKPITARLVECDGGRIHAVVRMFVTARSVIDKHQCVLPHTVTSF
ncbi:MAG: hypothetical protein A3B78_01515 [Omnitrophica WOR_2 bacterium RIFCSPHIGHO2_02_FULL_67_20]|nr:MAG: hypothetical protein A3B78_01515 [Omnitrophica WOR_2 bacterium RIFCSPHIGHO2_02_FULL_67_20]